MIPLALVRLQTKAAQFQPFSQVWLQQNHHPAKKKNHFFLKKTLKIVNPERLRLPLSRAGEAVWDGSWVEA